MGNPWRFHRVPTSRAVIETTHNAAILPAYLVPCNPKTTTSSRKGVRIYLRPFQKFLTNPVTFGCLSEPSVVLYFFAWLINDEEKAMHKEPNALQKLEMELKVAYLKHLRDIILDVFERPHISDSINKAIMGDLVFEKERPYKMTALINKIDEISLSYKTQKKMLVEIEDLLDEYKEEDDEDDN